MREELEHNRWQVVPSKANNYIKLLEGMACLFLCHYHDSTDSSCLIPAWYNVSKASLLAKQKKTQGRYRIRSS